MPRRRTDTPKFTIIKRGTGTTGAPRYYVQWWEAGASRRISCRTGSLKAAQRFLANFEAGWSADVAPTAPTIGDVLDGYAKARASKKLSPTVGYNIARLKGFMAYLSADMLTPERVERYQAARQREGSRAAPDRRTGVHRALAPATLRRELLTLKAALVWAQQQGWIATVPPIDAPPPGGARDRWLTRQEAKKLLASAGYPHIRVFLALALYTAGRAGAITGLTWDRVDFDGGIVDLGEGQGKKRRARVPLHDELRPILAEAHAARTCPYVVEAGSKRVASVKHGFRNAVVRAGLTGVTPHTLRHTAATWMAQRGVSFQRIAGYLGNSAATVERVYAHHSPDHMREAAAALSEEN